MKIRLETLPALAVLLCSHIAYAGVFGPSTFAQCLLDRLPGVGNDTAAGQIYAKCLREFPPARDNPEPAPLYRWYKDGPDCTIAKARDTASPFAGRLIMYACWRIYGPPR